MKRTCKFSGVELSANIDGQDLTRLSKELV